MLTNFNGSRPQWAGSRKEHGQSLEPPERNGKPKGHTLVIGGPGADAYGHCRRHSAHEGDPRRRFGYFAAAGKVTSFSPEAKRSFAQSFLSTFFFEKSRRSRPVIGTRAPEKTLRGATQFQNRATLLPLAPVLRQRGPRPSPGPLVALSSSGPFPQNPFSRGVSLCWAVTGLLMRRRGGIL